jgi:hypothetical protein
VKQAIQSESGSLWRTSANLRKDMRPIASRILGVGDQVKVYAVITVISQQSAVINSQKGYDKITAR